MDRLNSLFSLKGKTALVTGGSRGIGRMIAEGFVDAGANVIICARDGDACQETANQLSQRGKCTGLAADLSNEEGMTALVQKITQQDGALDILVNNAGASWGAPLGSFPEKGWDKVMDLNVKALFFLTQALLPMLVQNASQTDPARIINVGSVDGIRNPTLETYSYTASKAAVHQLTTMFASRLASKWITVNAIAPGPFESKMMAPVLATQGEEVMQSVPLKRLGNADDMAGLTLFLASKAGAYITGTVIPIDGGIVGAR